jgi:HD-like signal output (HDOD) protein
MCCAAATRFVVKAAGLRNLTGVFAAGLLHDIGRVALSEVAPGLYARVDTTLSGRDLVADEIRRVGLSHTEAGYELAMHWGLPDEIAVPVRFHLAPGDAPRARKESAIVSLANQMAHAQGAGLADNEGVFDGYDDALGILALDPEVAEAMLDVFLHMRDDSLREELL